MDLSKEKQEALLARLLELNIKDVDLVEKFILGSGSGGQKINKTSSCVYLKHVPSGIEIKCQKTRSRELNRYYARKELCERLEEIIYQEKSLKRQAQEKIRRQKRKRSKRSKEKMLDAKHKHAGKKKFRLPPSID